VTVSLSRLMQHADLLSGLLLAGAFLIWAMTACGGVAEWAAMVVFPSRERSAECPGICSDGANALCRKQGAAIQFPPAVLHIIAGILDSRHHTCALLRRRRTATDDVHGEDLQGAGEDAIVGYPTWAGLPREQLGSIGRHSSS